MEPGARGPVVACLVAALALAGLGGVGLARADSGTVVRSLTVDGVPLLEVSPAGAVTGRPGAVVAHGFSGSATLMRGFADTLAAQGYVVVLPDFTGHGRNPGRLPAGEPGTAVDPLQRDLAVAVRHLRALPTVDPTRIILIGHSMGAGAVVTYAATDPGIKATVAISLPSAEAVPADPARPANLLLLVGGAEFAGFREAALAAMRRSEVRPSFGATIGDLAAGTGRRAVSVPYTEHISVLFATRTHAETAAWLNRAVGEPAAAAPRPRDRLVPAGLLLAAFLLGFVPLAALLPAGTGHPEPVHARYAYGGLAAGLALAVLAAGVAPTTRLPLAVGGYAAGWFALTGAGLVTAYGLATRSEAGWRTALRAGPRQSGIALLLLAYAAVAVAVPLHLGLIHAVPVGARWWLLPVVIACVAVLLLGAELLAAGSWRRAALILATTAAVLLAATLAGRAPGFVLLVLPLLVVLLAWQAGWAALLRRRSAPAWIPALTGAVVVGWPIAVSLPLAG